MVHKKMFKVMSAIEKHGGGTYWMRLGTGFVNRDNSINIYLDAMPKTFQLQLRELDEEELRKRDDRSRGSTPSAFDAGAAAAASSFASGAGSGEGEQIPF